MVTVPPRALVASLPLFWLTVAACTSDRPASAPAAPESPAAATLAPSPAPPASGARQVDMLPTAHGELRITPLRHGTLLLEIAGQAIYVDPVGDIDYDGLPRAAAIFLTHGHRDHLDPAGLARVLDAATTVVIAPPAVAEALPETITRVTVMRPGEVSGTKSAIVPSLGPWFYVEAVPAYNLERGPEPGKLYHPPGSGVGYVLGFGDRRIYVSGDTECTPEMQALTDIDVAFVCMNLPYTMTPTEAGACIRAFRPTTVYPYHYRGSDLDELDAALAGAPGIEVRRRNWYGDL